MPKAEKVAHVEDLKQRLGEASSVVLVDFLGLTAPEMVELRRGLRRQGVEFLVVKNTLTRLAAEQAGAEYLLSLLRGPNAVMFGSDNPAAPFKAAKEYARKYPKLEIKGGMFSGEPVGADEVNWYASLPSREELLSRLAGGLAGPMRGLAVALAGVIGKLAVVLSEVQKQKASKE